MLGIVNHAGINDMTVGSDMHLYADLSFFIHGGIDVVNHTTMACAIADTAAASAAFSGTEAGACATADTTSGSATAATTAATVIHG